MEPLRLASGPEKLKTFIRVILFMLAVTLFFLQVKDVFEKYRDKKTTMTIATKSELSIPSPAFSFHPENGFNRVKAKSFGIDDPIDVFLRGNNLHFNNIDVYQNVSYVLGRDFEMNITFFDEHGYQESTDLAIGINTISFKQETPFDVMVFETYSPFRGISYTVKANRSMGMTHGLFYLTLDFNDTAKLPIQERPNIMQFYLLEVEERFGTFVDVWKGAKPFYFTMKMSDSGTVYWEKTVHTINKNTGRPCRNYMHNDSAIRCSQKLIGEDMRSKFEKSCEKLCFPAPHKTLMELALQEGKEVELCQTEHEMTCAGKYSNIINYGLSCEKPCQQTSYNGRIQTQNTYGDDGLIVLQFLLSSSEIILQEEVLLFDFATFVGSFGGSLGLFIGFSFFDFSTYISDKIINIFTLKK